MPFIAIIHVPDHTADAIRTVPLPAGHTLVGIFDYPHYRKDLKCGGTCTVKNTGAWRRDPRGFMKCSICGSRNRNLRRWLIGALFDWLGSNQLGDEAPAAFRTPEGYGPFPR